MCLSIPTLLADYPILENKMNAYTDEAYEVYYPCILTSILVDLSHTSTSSTTPPFTALSLGGEGRGGSLSVIGSVVVSQ